MFEEVKTMLIEQLGVKPEDVVESADLINDLGVNSLELADLILLCEEKYNMVISEEDIHNFATVGDIVNYLSEKTGK